MNPQSNPYEVGDNMRQQQLVEVLVTAKSINAILKVQQLAKFTGLGLFIIGLTSIAMIGAGRSLLILLVVYVLVGIAYIFIAVVAYRYAGAIQRLSESLKTDNLSKVLELQTKFWMAIMSVLILIIALNMMLVVSSL